MRIEYCKYLYIIPELGHDAKVEELDPCQGLKCNWNYFFKHGCS